MTYERKWGGSMLIPRFSAAPAVTILLLGVLAGCAPTPEEPHGPLVECQSLTGQISYSPPASNSGADIVITSQSGTALVGCTDETGSGVTGASVSAILHMPAMTCDAHAQGEVWGNGIATFNWNTGAVSVAGVEVIGDGTIGLRLALRINAGYWVGATASVRMQAMSSSGDCVNDPVENAVFTSTEPFVLHPVGWPLFVDQSNISDSSSYTDYVDGYSCDGVTWDSEVAQTFTADFTGRIAKVSLVARPISPNSSPLRVTIRPLDSDGSPGNSILGSGTYSGAGSSDTTTPIEVALTQPADVISTNEYAIVVSVPAVTACPTQSTYGWYVQGNGDSYAPGSVWSRGSLFNQSNWKQEPDHDLLFKTWMLTR